MTTTVLFIRHASHGLLGHVLCGRKAGVGLCDQGRGEADRLAEALVRRETVDAVYTSPLQRACETAEPIARGFRLGATIDEALTEIDFGDWSGCAFDDLAHDPRWAFWNRDRDHARPPNGEGMGEAQVRIVRAIEEIAERHPDATVALVTHGDIIKAALAWGLGLPLAFHARFEVSPASLSRMTFAATGIRVWSVNERLAA